MRLSIGRLCSLAPVSRGLELMQTRLSRMSSCASGLESPHSNPIPRCTRRVFTCEGVLGLKYLVLRPICTPRHVSHCAFASEGCAILHVLCIILPVGSVLCTSSP